MKEGDIVRLKQPFRPTATAIKAYNYGIVAGVVKDPGGAQILIRLYDLDRASVYVDPLNVEAIYGFRPEELDCYISL
jgi:hypothetical protein